MNNQEKFNQFREQYKEFIFDKYEITYDEEYMNIKYYFNIPDLTWFYPEIKINKKYILNNDIKDDYLNDLVFHIGLVELVSYFKCTCSKEVIIKCGFINEEQIEWFKKLYYNGLGEFLYTNHIEVSQDDLMHITCLGKPFNHTDINYQGEGNLICIGGGKDSCVSLEILKNESNNVGFIMNAKKPSLDCAHISGLQDNEIYDIKRILDRKIVELNNLGYLNGHTPFSSLVAFLSYLVCYLSNHRNIILSNESSANESTVLGTNINHQYSKSFEFENDFYNYTNTYFKTGIRYFSLLRGISEFQIGKLFSNYTKYHPVFKSCNVGSKGEEWVWCSKCPKCLFVYIILSPHLYKDKLINIFGSDLYTNEELLDTFKEILGYSETKPFECVGTYSEARYAISLLLQRLDNNNLPFLLKYYKDNYPLELNDKEILSYNEENNIPDYYDKLVKEELAKYDR